MQALHEVAATIGLAATAPFGFVLAGGYAIQAHGFLVRRSEDVDLFTTLGARAVSLRGSMQLSLLTGQRSWK
jgi:hypothetical protein